MVWIAIMFFIGSCPFVCVLLKFIYHLTDIIFNCLENYSPFELHMSIGNSPNDLYFEGFIMDDIGQRLDMAAEIGGFKSRRNMCENLEIPYGTLNNWIKRSNIPANGILEITSKIPISRTYLETGTGDPHLREDTGISNYAHEDRVDDVMRMYKELDPEDQRMIYLIIKRSWLTKDVASNQINDELHKLWE